MTEYVKSVISPATSSGMEGAQCYQVGKHQSTNRVIVGIRNFVITLILNADWNAVDWKDDPLSSAWFSVSVHRHWKYRIWVRLSLLQNRIASFTFKCLEFPQETNFPNLAEFIFKNSALNYFFPIEKWLHCITWTNTQSTYSYVLSEQVK